jgi:DNA-directed RNA polymerase III subunit RPC3
MSTIEGRLCTLVLEEVFGEIVAAIGGKLHQWNGQHLQQLMLPPRISRTPEALAVLINHNLVTFKECSRSGRVIYTLSEDRVLSLIQFPRYLIMCKTLFGDEGEIIVEELFKTGQSSMSSVIFRAGRSLRMAKKSDDKDLELAADTIIKLRNKFLEMTECQFLCRIPSPYTDETPKPEIVSNPTLTIKDHLLFTLPEIDFKVLAEALTKADDDPEFEMADNAEESKILWRINYDRFHREFRDKVLVQAVTRRIDSSAGNLMGLLLNIMNENDPWAAVSCHIRQNEIAERLLKCTKESTIGSDNRLQEFHDQYLKVIEEDRTRFIDKVGDAGGGQYVINAKHTFGEIAAAVAENIVLERFGSKASRIFRVIRQKLHVEEVHLQNLVMIPAKETKHLTYTLMESNFIKIQELRKSMAATNTMGKSFFLYYVDMLQVARMIIEHCHTAIGNAYMRKKHESSSNQRLLDKYERIESITANLKASEDLEGSEELQLQLQEVQDMVRGFFN